MCHCRAKVCIIKLVFKTHKWERDADSQTFLASQSVIFNFKPFFLISVLTRLISIKISEQCSHFVQLHELEK